MRRFVISLIMLAGILLVSAGSIACDDDNKYIGYIKGFIEEVQEDFRDYE